MTGLLERIASHATTLPQMKRGARVVVAVSGGVDSMVLLHALHTLAPGSGWKLSVAHFNHRLRGRSSDADERLVRDTARRLKLRCDVGAAEVRTAAAEKGVSIEMAARQLRHEFLARCARKRGATTVALAHHADDQVELYLLRLLRGSGGDGLGGMKAENPSPADKGVTLVRPLLEFPKEDIAAFARKARIRFREDTSNGSVEFDRNWVRHELLPLLRKRQPAIGKTILRTMQIAGTDAGFVTQMAAAWLNSARLVEVRSRPGKGTPRCGEDYDLPKGFQSLSSPNLWVSSVEFAVLHVAVQRRVIQLQVRALGVEPDFQLIEQLRTQPGRAVSAGPGTDLVCDDAGIVSRAVTDSAGFIGDQIEVEIGKFASSRRRLRAFGGLGLEWRVVRRGKSFSHQHEEGREFFDADKVGSRLLFRHWQAGDRFQPIGLQAAVKLQDWFTNRKVPAALRRKLVLAETERGALFWVEGERIGEACKVTATTRRLLELRWKRV